MIVSKQLNLIGDIRHGFYGRELAANSSHVLGYPLYIAKQVHGETIVRVDATTDPKAIAGMQADALWTTEPALTIGVKTGDCVPLLVAPKSGAGVMAVHLGWRGAANGLGPKSIRHFCSEIGVKPGDLVAAIGPCISFNKFEVRSDVVEALKKSVSPTGLIKTVSETQFKVDLQGWVERQLQDSGVVAIEKIERCTYSEVDIFHSARRDAGSAGRQLSCIVRS